MAADRPADGPADWSHGRARAALLGLLLLAGLLRFSGLRWDGDHHLHPDERFISMVEEKIAFPSSVSAYFDSRQSPLNPYNQGFPTFVYGTLPLFLTKAVAPLFGLKGYGGTYLVGRGLSAFFDLLNIWLTYLLAHRFGPRKTSLLAAGLLAFAPLAIQLSHFWAVDTFLTTFSLSTLLLALRHAQARSSLSADAAMGITLGMAVSCKVTGLALLVPVGLAILLRALGEFRDSRLPALGRAVASAAGRAFVIAVAAAAATRAFLPYAFLGPSPFSFRLDPRWLEDLRRLTQLLGSISSYPPAFQWAGRTFLFALENLVLWGAGPFFGLSALAAAVWAVVRIWNRCDGLLAIVFLHALAVIAYHGAATQKLIRYFYPSYPDLAVLAALALAALARRGLAEGRSRRRWLAFVPACVLIGTFLSGLAFSSIYRRPVTRVAASEWIYEHSPPAPFANESWDDALPLPLPGHDSAPYLGPTLSIVEPDSAKKADDLVAALSRSSWIAITSNRAYASLTRLPDVFPMATAYYRALFEGRLGFQPVADFHSYPSLGPLEFPDDSAEETFTVYDHPRVVLFRKTGGFSAERVRKILLAAIPQTPPAIWDWAKLPRWKQRIVPPLSPPRHGAIAEAAANPDALIGSLPAAVLFYVLVLAIGVAAFPISCALFPRLKDCGAGVSRVLGIVLATYLMTLLVQLRIIRSGRGAAIAVFLLLAAAGAVLFRLRRQTVASAWKERRALLVQGEVAFAAGFLLFLLFRAFNPEITWGEKPMDFSILNILVRTPTLPPSDPWFAGAPLGYYYFGQEMIAFLTLLSGISTRYMFNLAFGLLGGTIVAGAFSLARNWAGTFRAGLAGAGFVAILGNLSGFREWWAVRRPQHLPLDWHYFWATSRVIKDTINEYPFWSLLFADLHAHVLAIPIFLAVACAALQVVRAHADERATYGERVGSAFLLGFLAGIQGLTNAWDAPFLTGLLVLVALVVAWTPGLSAKALGRGGLVWIASMAGALATALPLWVRGGGRPGFGRNAEPGASGLDLFTVFGFFLVLALLWLLVALRDRIREAGFSPTVRTVVGVSLAVLFAALAFLSLEALLLVALLLFLLLAFPLVQLAEDRLAYGFVAAGFFLALFPQRFYINDRMNTFFKLYVESWIVLAIAAAVLVFRSPDRRGSFSGWPRLAKALSAVLFFAALFTSVTAARGALTSARPTLKVPSDPPTLDGLRYLETLRPGEYKAVLWLRRSLRGVPVVLEAQGDSYQDFGRISMFTGLPTVLGWEYHVKQRGNPEAEIETRREAVKTIYSTADSGTAEKLLRRYRVGFVYVGWLEKKTYPSAGLAKFDAHPDLFQAAYANPEAKVYRVVGGDSQDVIVPARETLAAGPGQAPSDEPEESPHIEKSPQAGLPPFFGMREPRDGDVDRQERVWIADFGNSRLRVFDARGGYLGGWGGRGSGTYGLREPCAVSIRGEDVYVADTWNGRVQHHALSGEWIGSAGGLYGPRGIAAAPDGSVWVTDTGNGRLVVYDAALKDSRTVGSKGSGPEQFSNPVGIAIGPSGRVYVADTGNRRIQALDSAGHFSNRWPVPGLSPDSEPHVEVDTDETIYLTDPPHGRLLVFDAAGHLRQTVSQDDTGRSFLRPTGLALNRARGILYVVNSGNNTVSVLQLSKRREK